MFPLRKRGLQFLKFVNPFGNAFFRASNVGLFKVFACILNILVLLLERSKVPKDILRCLILFCARSEWIETK